MSFTGGKLPASIRANASRNIHKHVQYARNAKKRAMNELNKGDLSMGCHLLLQALNEVINAVECSEKH